MKRIFSLLLCLCILLSSAVFLSSCGDDDGKPDDNNGNSAESKVDFDGYLVVNSSGASDHLQSACYRFVRTLNKAFYSGSKDTFSFVSDDSRDEEAHADREILIGHTNRQESAQALAQIEGDGYCICLIGKKIVINGTTDLLVAKALDAFATKYLTEGMSDTKIAIESKTITSNLPMVKLDANTRIVYSASLDDSTDTTAWGTPSSGFEYAVDAAKKLQEQLVKTISVAADKFETIKDSKHSSGNEITIGSTNRNASVKFNSSLDVNEYGYEVNEKGVVIGGNNDTTLGTAVTYFLSEIVPDSVVTVDGKKEIRLPVGESETLQMPSKWVTDFPRPTGTNIKMSGSVDVFDDSVELYYTGTGISAVSYEKYCESLTADGFTLHSSNTIEGSMFRCYVNNQKGITLYVSFFAYSHAAEQQVTMYSRCFKIIAAPTNAVNLLPDAWYEPDLSYTKRTDPKLTALKLKYADTASYMGNTGNSYVITLEDGSFLVMDGGSCTSGSFEYAELYKVLTDLHTQTYGTPPTAEQPIVIAAWYLSHAHGDHYGNFYEFCKAYGKSSTVKIECMITNLASSDEVYHSHEADTFLSRNLRTLSGFVKGGLKYYKVHTGDEFWIRNMKIEVLYTHEDLYPNHMERFNDSGIASRFYMYTTDGKGNFRGEVSTSLWLGDTFYGGSQSMRAMFGSYLKTDLVQVSHHWYKGCEFALYQLVDPSYVYYACSLERYNWIIKQKTREDGVHYLISKELDNVEYVIISDIYNTTVTYKADGPDYTDLYNAGYGSVKIEEGTSVLHK